MKEERFFGKLLKAALVSVVIGTLLIGGIVGCSKIQSTEDAESTAETTLTMEDSDSDLTVGIVTDKKDYVLSNPKGFSQEIYLVTLKDDQQRTRTVRVTSVTYQSIKIGDKFDVTNHINK